MASDETPRGPEPAPARPRGGGAAPQRPAGKLRAIGDAIMVRQTLFSLPFAVAAVLLETRGRPPAAKLLWIMAAAAAARNAANALNRVIDRDIDAANPRTAGRHLPAGLLSVRDLGLFAALMLGLLAFSAAMLNWLCFALLPLAGFLVVGYSYSKRFTWLCHYWLGLACSAATMGAFLGISGRFELRYFAMAGAVALWVAGFDILYALQDIEVDRAQGLRSIPARFGPRAARWIAALSHALAIAGLGAAAFFWPLGPAYLAAVLGAAALLAAEHIVALGGTERHIRIAAYGINEIVPLVVLSGVALDLYLL
jgi:4-hydroxybenzoate polyprenyltransferase